MPLEKSNWFMVIKDLGHLNAAIRQADAPEAQRPIESLPCGGQGSCKEWTGYTAANAAWAAAVVEGKLVAIRWTTFGDMQEKSLDHVIVGPFVVSMLRERDDLCPGRPEERCRDDWNSEAEPGEGELRLCESDASKTCVEGGIRGYIEVFDVAKAVVYRLEEVRHVKQWRGMARKGGGVTLEIDDCVVEL